MDSNEDILRQLEIFEFLSAVKVSFSIFEVSQTTIIKDLMITDHINTEIH